MNELHLVLEHKWFDLFERGIKPEEYRERTPYWKKRIWDRRGEIDTLTLHKGYTDNTLSCKVKEIVEATGNPEWGAEPGKVYYVIKVIKVNKQVIF